MILLIEIRVSMISLKIVGRVVATKLLIEIRVSMILLKIRGSVSMISLKFALKSLKFGGESMISLFASQ